MRPKVWGLLKEKPDQDEYLYQSALKTRKIDYWGFNCCLHFNKPKDKQPKYFIFCTRDLDCAENFLGLRRIRLLKDRLYYGISLNTTKYKTKDTKWV